MFWKLTALSASSPVESILDKENFTLEELLDEEEIIQECKALNSRLINFLRDRMQVEQLLQYVIEEPPEDADSKRAFKFPFIACEIFTCEIDVILKTLVEEEGLMDLLFSFLNPDRPHSASLAGYFSKVVICLMLRKTVALMNYVQAHHDVFRQLVDLIGITSIMEVLIRLVGADDVYPNFLDVMQWLADSNLLEMIVDKLNPSCPPEVHANAAETLCAITRNAPSALANKLSSQSFVERVFGHALEDSHSKSGLVQSLSVCISLLDPKRSAISSSLFHSFRGQHMYGSPVPVSSETISAMLPRLGDLLVLLNVSSDQKILPTAFGELRPPLGKHRLKIVEFIAVLMRSGNEAAEKELINSGTIQRVINLFFEYPYNNAMHHHVESIISSCLESKSYGLADHLFGECNLVGKILQTDKVPNLSHECDKPTLPAAGKLAPRAGNIGHITRISNKLVQMSSSNGRIQNFLKGNDEWIEWQTTVLQERNKVENVYGWACGRPTNVLDREKDSDDDDLHDRDYDVAALANNLNQAFSYKIYGNDDTEEVHIPFKFVSDVYFDDESAEVVVSSLTLGDHQGSLFTNSNWFAFQDERIGSTMLGSSSTEMMEDINLNGTAYSGNSSSDDEVVLGEDEDMTGGKLASNGVSTSELHPTNEPTSSDTIFRADMCLQNETASASHDPFMIPENEDVFGDRPLPEWVGWGESSDFPIGGSSMNPFEDPNISIPYQNDEAVQERSMSSGESGSPIPNGVPAPDGSITPTSSSDGSVESELSQKSPTVPSLFEEDVEFVGVEVEGTEKAMEHALKEGIVGEAGPLKRSIAPKMAEKQASEETEGGMKEFNDANYWRVDQEVAVLE
ncbi:hypothetical protein SAY86_002277 [Trapa natans]|uniref:SIT4 phosphatase-associated family protein n=1 Tax=Trapa natans TaxID=22666 RepID=A0AAN7LPV4_TRANT|nr:hypothetical protein SAY86_002277 [Trapa natans]